MCKQKNIIIELMCIPLRLLSYLRSVNNSLKNTIAKKYVGLSSEEKYVVCAVVMVCNADKLIKCRSDRKAN